MDDKTIFFEEYEKSKYDDEEFEIEIIVDNYEDTSETQAELPHTQVICCAINHENIFDYDATVLIFRSKYDLYKLQKWLA